MTLGSLFDGAGGFPLAGAYAGIEPVWASEIVPFAVAVTSKRFPGMKHLGDITKINGGEIDPVDIVTFGSPCTDLSLAGKREGIRGKQSGLFFEAIRVIKEMREATHGIYPTFAVWENVLGTFNSNGGKDFREVLQAFVEIAQTGILIAQPDKWSLAGEIVGDGFSVAWRTFDSQYWGVPQRRRRIYLVADFRGQRAGEILFKSESHLGRFETRGETRQKTTANTANGAEISIGADGKALNPHDGQSQRIYAACGVAPTLSGADGGGGRYPGGTVLGVASAQANAEIAENISPTLMVGDTRAYAVFSYGYSSIARGIAYSENISPTLRAGPGDFVPAVVLPGIAPTLTGDHENRVSDYTGIMVEQHDLQYIVRRLTPTECARLQGFPDGWCADVPHSDSAEYRLWGNSLTIHVAYNVLANIAQELRG
jgi:DNA (cytosine-5)-methyltransferase 1